MRVETKVSEEITISPRAIQDINDPIDIYNQRRSSGFGNFIKDIATNAYQGRFQPFLLAKRPSIIGGYLLTQDGAITKQNKRKLGRDLARVISFIDQNPQTSISSHYISALQKTLGITNEL